MCVVFSCSGLFHYVLHITITYYIVLNVIIIYIYISHLYLQYILNAAFRKKIRSEHKITG